MTIVKYHAPWCGPCKMTKRVWESFKEKHIETLFKEVNTDEFMEDTKENNVLTLPTVIFKSREGKEIERITGAFSEKQLETAYEAASKYEQEMYRL